MKGVFPTEELAAIQTEYPHYRVESLFVPDLDGERHCVIIPREQR
jgi:16S rRNA G527 N7-methylase RsmG